VPLDDSHNTCNLAPLWSYAYLCPATMTGSESQDVAQERSTMPKGQEKPKTLNKPKLSIKEKKQKKKDKAAKPST
jgi:hypothetical protein